MIDKQIGINLEVIAEITDQQFINQELTNETKKSIQDIYHYMLPQQYTFAVTRQSIIENWNDKKDVMK